MDNLKLWTVGIKITTETDTGKTKSYKETYVVRASNIKTAIDIMEAEFHGLNENWEIVNIKPSGIIAVLNNDGLWKVTRKKIAAI